jgi:hypothetical protein
MSALGAPKAERALCGRALRKLKLRRAHCVLSFLQIGKIEIRRCISCDTPVTNRNLGGHARKSALAGLLWCQRCADGILERGNY